MFIMIFYRELVGKTEEVVAILCPRSAQIQWTPATMQLHVMPYADYTKKILMNNYILSTFLGSFPKSGSRLFV